MADYPVQHPTHPAFTLNEEVVANGLHNSKLCQRYQYSLGLSLLPHLAFVQLLSSLERNRRGRTYYGKNVMEDTRLMMLGMSISAWRVVEWFMDPRPDEPTGCTCECCNRRNDRGIRGMDGT